MLRLAKYFGDERYERFAKTVLRLAADQIRQHPQGFGRSLAAIEFALSPVKEIVVAGPAGNQLETEVRREYRPFIVVAPVRAASDEPPLVKDRGTIDGQPAAYVCEGFVCKRPVTEIEELTRLLEE